MTTTHPDLEKCHSYVVHHLSGEGQPRHTEETGMPFVTISRQAGAGGRSFGKMLQTYLDEHAPLSKGHWTLFDDNLVKQAMKEHGLHKRFAQYLPENRISELTGIIGELVGLHPPIWELYQHVYETVLHLANIGGVILVGRGAHVVTRRLRRGVHLRLISRPENRAERAAKFYDMPIAQARSFIHHEDRARRLWVKDNFNEDVDDPCAYDMILNADRLSQEHMASLVADLIMSRNRVRQISLSA